jgi:tetratricopeptide (TPR) repeat protein
VSVGDSSSGGPRGCAVCGGSTPAEQEICPSCEETRSQSAGAPPLNRYTGPQEIAGYRILRELGTGGMGTVFEAFEEKMKRRVALKLLSRHLSQSQKAGSRFAREAWIAGKLNHPNLIKVFERGELEDVAFISMELADGGSLQDVVRNLKVWGRDESWKLEFGSRDYIQWAIAQVVAAARGLDCAHRQGVVHRDVKPANILLNRDPCTVKVADFGLALDSEATRVTTVGTILGTVAYMAPEQIRGRHDQVGPWTDAYSLGVTLFELLTLDLPYAGATQQLYLNAVLTAAAKRTRALNQRVSRDLEVVIQKVLEKDPKDRYRSAAEFAEDLENVTHFRPIRAHPPGTGVRVFKWARRKPIHAILAASMILGLPALLLLSYNAILHRRLVERLETHREAQEVNRLNHDGRLREALPLLDRLLARNPDDMEMLQTSSFTRFNLARIERDPKVRADLQAQALSDASHLVRLEPQASWPYHIRAYISRAFGKTAEAEQDERAAAARRTGSPSDKELEIDGVLALKAGRLEEAAGAFSKIILRHKDASTPRLYRALAYERLGENAKAMTDYEIAAALHPDNPVPRIDLGRLLGRAGDLERGHDELREALGMDPNSATAYEGLADNLIRQGKVKAGSGTRDPARQAFRDAAAAARESLRLDADRPWAHLNLGVALMEGNRLTEPPSPAVVAEAVQEYQKAIELAQRLEGGETGEILRSALVNQCDALIQLEELRRALLACTRIAELEPGNPNNQYNLAAVYALSNRPEEAFKALDRDFALGDRDYGSLAADKWFASLHADRRFAAMLDRMKKAAAPRP